jgi:hypothetical protein
MRGHISWHVLVEGRGWWMEPSPSLVVLGVERKGYLVSLYDLEGRGLRLNVSAYVLGEEGSAPSGQMLEGGRRRGGGEMKGICLAS